MPAIVEVGTVRLGPVRRLGCSKSVLLWCISVSLAVGPEYSDSIRVAVQTAVKRADVAVKLRGT